MIILIASTVLSRTSSPVCLLFVNLKYLGGGGGGGGVVPAQLVYVLEGFL